MTKPIQIADLSTSTVQPIETLVLPLAVAAPMARAFNVDEGRDPVAKARTTATQPTSADAPLLTYWVAG
jgi:hypothetical protein